MDPQPETPTPFDNRKKESQQQPIPEIAIGENGFEYSTFAAVSYVSRWLFHKSGLIPKSFQNPDQVAVVLIRARELGLPALQALEGMSVINGKIGIMGDLALAMVEHSGLLEQKNVRYNGESPDDIECILTLKRKNRVAQAYTFSVKEAKAANIYDRSPTWKAYPKRMVYYRALGFGLRSEFPDILRGMVTSEELADIIEPKEEENK